MDMQVKDGEGQESLKERLTGLAKEQGFDHTAFMPVEELVFVPEYRKYCAQNLCGNYNKLKNCPPKSGTVEEMEERAKKYHTAFVMQTIQSIDIYDPDEIKLAKHRHNEMTRAVARAMEEEGVEGLVMSAGPTAESSCMSAYCVDAARMARSCHLEYWLKDGTVALFSQFLF